MHACMYLSVPTSLLLKKFLNETELLSSTQQVKIKIISSRLQLCQASTNKRAV